MFSQLFHVAILSAAAGTAPDLGAPVTLPVAGMVATADFNGDGFSDLAVAGESLFILIARGDGGFHPATTYGPLLFETGRSIKCVDLNGDGHVDVATGNYVYFGTGNGTFSSGTWWGWQYRLRDLLVGDVNGDGATDLVPVDDVSGLEDPYFAYAFSTYLNNGSGELEHIGYIDISVHSDANWALADCNGDGLLDIAFGGGSFIFFVGNGDGTFSWPGTWWENAGRGAVFADFNADGTLDVRSREQFLFGNGDGTFTSFAASYADILSSRSTADFNRDGAADVISSTSSDFGYFEVEFIRIHLGGGDGSLSVPRDFTLSDHGVYCPFGRAAIGDFNGDGFPDVAVGAGQNGVQVLINDGDWVSQNAPRISVADVSVSEGFEGETVARFPVVLSASSATVVTVYYALANGTALVGEDFWTSSGTLIFQPGETSKWVDVIVFGDAVFEPDETFFVNLSEPVNATIADGTAQGTILNDDYAPSPVRLEIGGVSRSEGDRGSVKFTFTVQKVGATNQSVTVSYRTADGTATIADGDYSAANGTLTFSPGQTSRTITVQVRSDRKREADETFHVDLFGPSANATIGQSRGTGTIGNDD